MSGPSFGWRNWTSARSWRFGCAGRSAGDLFCVGGNGVILHTSDGGSHWVSIASGTARDLALPVAAAGTILAVGNNGVVLKYF